MSAPPAAGPPRWVFAPLPEDRLGEARRLLTEALPLDGIAQVAHEKLFGGNGARRGHTEGAFCPGSGRLLGVLSRAGRWVKLLAVLPEARRQGLGTALLTRARADLLGEIHHAGKDPGERPRPPLLRLCDHPGNYLSPGLDLRYSSGREFLLRRGFREKARVQNMRAPLRNNPLITGARALALREQAARQGYAVRRVGPGDVAPLLAMIAEKFAPVWAYEVAKAIGPLAMTRATASVTGAAATSATGAAGEELAELPEGPAVHAAFLPSGEPVAFAAHDGNNRGLGWFGPMGTLADHRGKQLGETLLLSCLLDVADRPEGGVIAWVGPIEFYRRACGAQVDRQFLVYEES